MKQAEAAGFWSYVGKGDCRRFGGGEYNVGWLCASLCLLDSIQVAPVGCLAILAFGQEAVDVTATVPQPN